MTSLGTLEIGLKLNRTVFDAELKSLQQKISSGEMSREISIKVDDSELTELNKHIDKKIRHIKELRAEAEKGITLKTSTEDIGGGIADNIKREMDKAGQSIKDALNKPFKDVITGFGEGLGQQLSRWAVNRGNRAIKSRTGSSLGDWGGAAFSKKEIERLVAKAKNQTITVEANTVDAGRLAGSAANRARTASEVAFQRLTEIADAFRFLENKLKSQRKPDREKTAQATKQWIDKAWAEVAELEKQIDPSLKGKVAYRKGRITRASNLIDKNLPKNVSDEVMAGLGSDTDKATEIGKEIGEKMIKGTKDSLGIKSPSREFKKILDACVQALELGQKAVSEAGKNIGNSFARSFEDAVNAGHELKRSAIGAIKQSAKPFSEEAYQNNLSRVGYFAPAGSQQYMERALLHGFEGIRKKLFASESPFAGRMIAREAFINTPAVAGAMFAPTSTSVMAAMPVIQAMLPTIIGALGAFMAVSPMIRRGIDAVTQTETITSRLGTVSPEGLAGAGKEYKYLIGLADEYKISLRSLQEGYTGLANATKGTNLEGDSTRELFEGIVASMKALRLPMEDAGLVLSAYTQIAAKGQLSMEELRQQLGEKFPPAMQIFARALKVSVPEMIQMISSGSVLAEEVLPAVAKELQRTYGDLAKTSGDDLSSSLERLQTASVEFSRKFTEAFGPVIRLVGSFAANMAEAFNNVFPAIAKLVPPALITGFAQLAIATKEILAVPRVAAFATTFQNTIMAVWKTAFSALTPFAIGIFADVIDDIFGANTSVMENMYKGVAGYVILLIEQFLAIKNAIGSLFDSSLGQTITTTLSSIGQALESVFKPLPTGLIEVTAIYLALEQTIGLVRMYLIPQLAALGKALWGITRAMWANITSAHSFKAILASLALGSALAGKALLVLRGVIINVVAAFALMAMATGDMVNEVGTSLFKSQRKMKTVFSEMKTQLEDFRKEAAKPFEMGVTRPRVELKSKGAQLNPLEMIFQSGTDSFLSDDLGKAINNPNGGFIRGFAQAGKTASQAFWGIFKIGQKDTMDVLRKRAKNVGMEKYVGTADVVPLRGVTEEIENMERLTNQTALVKKELASLGLTYNTTADNLKTQFAPVTQQMDVIDAKLKQLEITKIKAGQSSDPASRSAFLEADKEMQSLLKQRKELAKPILIAVGNIDIISQQLQAQREAIEKADIPVELKLMQLAELEKSEELVTKIGKEIEKYKEYIDPIQKAWMDAFKPLQQARAEFEKISHAAAKTDISKSIELEKSGAKGTVKEIQAGINQLESAQAKLEQSRNIGSANRQALNNLLSIPGVETSKDKADEIQRLRDEVKQNEIDVLQGELDVISLEKSVTEARRKRALELRDFAKTIGDFQRTLEDFKTNAEREVIGFNNSVYDYNFSVAEFNKEQFRSFRNLSESYQDLYRSIEQQTLAAENAIKETTRKIDSIALKDRLSDLNPTGVANPFQGALDTISSLSDALDQFEQGMDAQAETRLSIEQQNIEIARQIRGLYEQQSDMETARLQSIRQFAIQAQQLAWQQEDFARNQKRQWEDILYQQQQIAQQAYEIGIGLDDIGKSIAASGQGLIDAIANLAGGLSTAYIPTSASYTPDSKSFAPTSPSFVPTGGGGSKQQALIKAAQMIGMPPHWLSMIVARETGGKFDPDIVGGYKNRYRGLIQFGGPERQAHGVYPGQSFEEQITKSVVSFFKSRGFKQGMSLAQAYATVLAGSPKYVDRRDVNGSAREAAARDFAPGGHWYKVGKQFLAGAIKEVKTAPVAANNIVPVPRLPRINKSVPLPPPPSVRDDLMGQLRGVAPVAPIAKPNFSEVEADRQRALQEQQKKEQELAKKQLESAIGQANRQLIGDSFRTSGENIAIKRGLEDLNLQWQDMARNAKGYLTIQERIAKAGEDAITPMRSLKRQLEDTVRENSQILEVGQNAQGLDDLNAQITRIRESTTLGTAEKQKYIAQIQKLIEAYQSGVFKEYLDLQKQELTTAQSMIAEIDRKQAAVQRLNEELERTNALFEQQQGLFNASNEATAAEQRNRGGEGLFDRANYDRIMFENSDAAMQKRLQDESQRLNIAPNTSQYYELADSLERIQKANISGAFRESSQAMQQFEDTLVGVLMGTTNLNDGFKSLFNTIAAEIIKLTIVRPIVNMLGGLFGGIFGGFGGGGFGGSGIFSGFSGGGAYTGIGPGVLSFAGGGFVSSQNIAKAMINEKALSGGGNPVLAVLNDREYIVSGKDGQLFEEFKREQRDRGMAVQYASVKNFSQGGFSVGSASRGSGGGTGGGNTYIINSRNTITVPTASYVGESLDQIKHREEQTMSRASQRFK